LSACEIVVVKFWSAAACVEIRVLCVDRAQHGEWKVAGSEAAQSVLFICAKLERARLALSQKGLDNNKAQQLLMARASLQ